MALTADEMKVKNRAIVDQTYPGLRDDSGNMLKAPLTACILDQIDAAVVNNEEMVRADLIAYQQLISANLHQQITAAQTLPDNLTAKLNDIMSYVVQPVQES